MTLYEMYVRPARAPQPTRLPIGWGLTLAMLVSLALWAGLIFGAARLIGG